LFEMKKESSVLAAFFGTVGINYSVPRTGNAENATIHTP
jgi:hypothetical protein